MDRRTELLNRTDEEWTAVAESGASEYWEDRAYFYQFQLEEAKARIERLGGLNQWNEEAEIDLRRQLEDKEAEVERLRKLLLRLVALSEETDLARDEFAEAGALMLVQLMDDAAEELGL